MDKPSARWDWFSVVLIVLLLQVAAVRLLVANWAPFLYFAETLTALGSILGLALGASNFKRSVVVWIAIDYSLMVIPWQWAAAVQSAAAAGYRERLLDIASRLGIAFTQFIHRAPVSDSFLFVAFMSLLMWIVSLTAGYWLVRHDNLPVAVIPSAIVIVTVQIYDNYFQLRSWWLAVYIFLVLLLIGRRYYLRRRAQMWSEHIAMSEDAWPNVSNNLLVIALVSVFVAWIFPTSLSSLKTASSMWKEISNPVQNRFSNAVVSLQSPHNVSGTDYYGTLFQLGSQAAQGSQPMFTVEVLSAPTTGIAYYWRARTFDFYSKGQWTNSNTKSLDFDPSDPNLNLVNGQGRVEATFQFTMQRPQQGLLYAPSEPVWVDHPGSVIVASSGNGQEDPIAWFADPAVETEGQYRVRAEIANPTVEALRAAGTDYPAWVQDSYLEVPQDIRPALQALSEKITNGKSTPYDKAQAVTDYLRKTIQYSTTVPAPPSGEDPAIWFLTNYKKGFCNYYASAEVLLLRSIGVPARMAVGFAEGQSVNDTLHVHNRLDVYEVEIQNAHAWPEAYFPGIGWIKFEPTVIQSPITRPDENPLAGAAQNTPSVPNAQKIEENPLPVSNAPAASIFGPRLMQFLLTVLWLVLLGLLIVAFRRYHLMNWLPIYLASGLTRLGMSTPSWIDAWIRWNQMTSVEHSFASVNLSLWWLGSPQPIYATAAERTAVLRKLLPSAAQYIETVSSEHQAALFTRHPVDPFKARRAGIMIVVHTLRFKLREIWNGISGGDVELG